MSSFEAERFRALLESSRLGRSFSYFPETDSSNQRLKELQTTHPPEGTLLLADLQSQGRGRWGRRWEAKPGLSLLFSLLLCPGRDPLGQLSPLIGLACLEALGLDPLRLKWPNDLWTSNGKLGGILLEGEKDYLIVGVGINVNQEVEDFPEPLRGQATSLRLETGRAWEREALLASLILSIEREYEAWKSGAWEDLRKRWNDKALYLGRRVKAGRHQGIHRGLAENGALLIENEKGIQSFSSGEIEELRPLLD